MTLLKITAGTKSADLARMGCKLTYVPRRGIIARWGKEIYLVEVVKCRMS